MPLDDSSPPLPEHVESAVRRQVESVLAAKLAEYKRVVPAFLLGSGLLFTILIANRLISQNSLLVYLHDEIFGSERNLGSGINLRVALSYSNQFALTTKGAADRAADAGAPERRVLKQTGQEGITFTPKDTLFAFYGHS